MSTMVTELYQALRSVGATEAAATAAAQAVWQPEQPATKGDVLALKADIEAVRADLTKTIYTTVWTSMLAMTAIFSAISAALRFVK
jgi:hypothetical protein